MSVVLEVAKVVGDFLKYNCSLYIQITLLR